MRLVRDSQLRQVGRGCCLSGSKNWIRGDSGDDRKKGDDSVGIHVRGGEDGCDC